MLTFDLSFDVGYILVLRGLGGIRVVSLNQFNNSERKCQTCGAQILSATFWHGGKPIPGISKKLV